jgi:predicted Zn finger-like uncharacterized protein
MALATQCPHCHTTFRVAHDQLKLRAGLVRCGVCKQIFNGIENLLRPEEAEKAFPPTPAQATEPTQPPAPSSAPIAAPTTSSESESDNGAPGIPAAEGTLGSVDFDLGMDTPIDRVEPEIPATKEEEPAALPEGSPVIESQGVPHTVEEPQASADPLLRMTLLDIAPKRGEQAEQNKESATDDESSDGLQQTIDDLRSKPWRSEEVEPSADELDRVDENEYEEPAFVRQARRRQRVGKVLRVVMAVLLPFLLAGAFAQAAYALRAQIAAWFPQARPSLEKMCEVLRCEVGFPTRIDVVSIDSNELQAPAVEGGPFTLNVLLRNRGTIVQTWPNIELTLNDANDKPIARRVFMPRDYLPATVDAAKGFAARSEQPVKLYLDLQDLKASGYRVYVFYP